MKWIFVVFVTTIVEQLMNVLGVMCIKILSKSTKIIIVFTNTIM